MLRRAAAALLLALAAAPPALAQEGAVTRDYVAGRWTDNGDCAEAVALRADGRFLAANGNEGLWALAGDRLTLQGERRLTMRIVPVDRDTMDVLNEDGSRGRSTRCGGGDAGAPAPALTAGYMVGRWTDNEDCADAVVFRTDGRFVAADNAEGRWDLAGDRLTLEGVRTVIMRIVPIDRDTVSVINEDGSLGRSTRC